MQDGKLQVGLAAEFIGKGFGQETVGL